MDKQYAPRDMEYLDSIGGYYSKHVTAMGTEGLTSKSDIAAELAHRDAEIDFLQKRIKELDLYFGQLLVTAQAAVIECEHGKGANVAMEWIFNFLAPRGEQPNSEEKDAGAFHKPRAEDIWQQLEDCYCFFLARRDAKKSQEFSPQH